MRNIKAKSFLSYVGL